VKYLNVSLYKEVEILNNSSSTKCVFGVDKIGDMF
jgi:hypothetical protein